MAAHGPRTVAAVLVAGGSGSRLAADRPKGFVTVGGRTLLEHAAGRFTGHSAITQVIVVVPESHVDDAAALIGLPAVAGGATRQGSVRAGLAALGSTIDAVLVHDVARAFVPVDVITAVITALEAGADAVVPVVPIHDTVRRINQEGRFVELLDRSTMVAIQTPQGFDRAVLVAAHDAAGDAVATDDAALVEALGRTVVPVPGADAAFKITRPWDLVVAEAVARG